MSNTLIKFLNWLNKLFTKITGIEVKHIPLKSKRVYPSAQPYTKNVMIAAPVKKIKKKKQPKPKPSIAVCRKMYRCRHGKSLHN